jgi:aflatoxin B1 aldehyde reductase
MSGV